MPWLPMTREEVIELEERYGDQMDVILIPTQEGLLEIRRLNTDSEDSKSEESPGLGTDWSERSSSSIDSSC